MSERILVTGAAGFTGRHLTSRLIELGHDVIGLTRSPAGGELSSQHEWIVGDLADAQQTDSIVESSEPSMIIHLAGEARPNVEDKAALLVKNIGCSANLLDALAKASKQPKRVIFASSSHVYGPQSTQLLHEGLCVNPNTIYACSKFTMEQIARSYGQYFEVVITRPFNYTGRGQKNSFVVPKIVSHFRQHKSKVKLGSLYSARDYADVRDVADIYARLITSPIQDENRILNISTGNTYTLARLIEICERLAGYDIEIELDSQLQRKNDPEIIQACTKKITRFTGQFRARPIEETLEWMLNDEGSCGLDALRGQS